MLNQKWPFNLTDSGGGSREDCEAVMSTTALGTWDTQQTGSINVWINIEMANIVVLWFPEDDSLRLEWPSYFWSDETRPKLSFLLWNININWIDGWIDLYQWSPHWLSHTTVRFTFRFLSKISCLFPRLTDSNIHVLLRMNCRVSVEFFLALYPIQQNWWYSHQPQLWFVQIVPMCAC